MAAFRLVTLFLAVVAGVQAMPTPTVVSSRSLGLGESRVPPKFQTHEAVAQREPSLNQRFRRLNLFGNIPTSDQSVGAAFAGAPHMDPTVENLRNTIWRRWEQ